MPVSMSELSLRTDTLRPRIAHCDREIGSRLAALRAQLQLSQRDLAFEGCSFAYLSRIETGSRTPSLTVIRRLADDLGTTEEFLCWGTESAQVNWRKRALTAEAELDVAYAQIDQLQNELASLKPQRKTVRAA